MVITTSGKSLAFSVSGNATFAFYLQELMFLPVIYSRPIEAQPREQLGAFWQYLFIIINTCQTARADTLHCTYSVHTGQYTLHTIISSGGVCKGCLTCKHCKLCRNLTTCVMTVVQICSWGVSSGHGFVLIQSPRT